MILPVIARKRRSLASLSAILWLCCATAGRADTISASITFCENLNVLRNPDNEWVAQVAALNTLHGLLLARTNPYLELRNTSEEAPITEFALTIGRSGFDFDWAKMIEASPGVTFTLQNLDMLVGNLRTDVLKISFTDFDPGEFVRFRVGLSPQAVRASQFVDYRAQFFTMNGSDTSDNAIASVTFGSEGGPTTESQVVPDFTNPGHSPTFLTFPCHFGQDTVRPFSMVVSGEVVPPTPIPEPSTVVLAGLGALALAGWRMRSHRRRR